MSRFRPAARAAVAAVLALPAATAAAQTTIPLEGTVTGENAAPLAGAQVVVTNEATQETRRATTTAAGGFRVLGLTSGRYAVTVRAIGYRPAADAVQLVVGQRARLAFALERGATDGATPDEAAAASQQR